MGEAADVIKDFYEGLRPEAGEVLADTGVVPAGTVRRTLDDALDDELLASGDADAIRTAIAQAVARAERDHAWREGLVGAGLDSPAGRRVLSAVRHAVHALELDAIVRDVRDAHTPEDAEQVLAARLERIDRDAAAELDRTVPDVFDVYRLPSGATWLLPRDPGGRPLFWNRRAQRFEADPRMGRDRAIANIGQLLGSGWRTPAATFRSVPEAAAWCRRQPGHGDEFQRALEAERDGEV